MVDSTENEESQKKNVKSLVKHKQEKVEKELRRGKKNKGLTKKDVFSYYAHGLDKTPTWKFQEIPHNFKVVESLEGKRLIIKIDEQKVCRYVDEDFVVSTLITYWKESLSHIDSDDFWLDHRSACELVKYWRSSTVPVPMPALLAWADEDIYCFRKLPFSYTKNCNFPPMFLEICGRMTNADAFCKFIGSLFYEEANRQQYCWLYGEGQNGKGSLAEVLADALGPAYQALSTDKDNHWTEQIINCRLGVFPDTNSISFVTSGLFKALTGGDSVRVNPKGRRAYTIKPQVKFLFLSNFKPSITAEKASTRRAIFCELAPIVGAPDPKYRQRLWSEAGEWFSYCRDMYETHLMERGHAEIPVTEESIDEITQDHHDYFEGIFKKLFESTSLRTEFAPPSEVHMLLLKEFNHNPKQISEFKSWLRASGYPRSSYRDGDDVLKRYLNMKIRKSGFYAPNWYNP